MGLRPFYKVISGKGTLLRTLVVWALGLPITVVLFFLVILSIIIDRSGSSVHSIGAFWSRIMLILAGCTVRVKGIENIPEKTPLVILSNHQGAFDIPVLQANIPLQFRWVAKKSLFRIPVIGWSMSLAGYVAIDRGGTKEALRSIDEAAESIKNGISVVVFPEGTRASTDELLPFKRGGFMLASRSRAPIVPVAIRGTRDIMRRGSLLIRPKEVVISIGEPIRAEGRDENGLMKEVKEAIEKMLRGNL